MLASNTEKGLVKLTEVLQLPFIEEAVYYPESARFLKIEAEERKAS